MPFSEVCDVCGQEVTADVAIRAEMATSELMCPVSMTMHPDCYQRAAALWHIDPEGQCPVDPELPELGRWTTVAPRDGETLPWDAR